MQAPVNFPTVCGTHSVNQALQLAFSGLSADERAAIHASRVSLRAGDCARFISYSRAQGVILYRALPELNSARFRGQLATDAKAALAALLEHVGARQPVKATPPLKAAKIPSEAIGASGFPKIES